LWYSKTKILPSWLFANIITQLVLPKLEKCLDNWNTKRDGVGLHAWLFPWFSLLGDALEPIWISVRRKLQNHLMDWDPKDESVFEIIKVWQEVFLEII
jgi:tuftelin-interacting protein 11